MDDRPTFVSLFSGIGGFDLGLERAGWRPVAQVEIDPHCRSVLRRHWPGVPIHEDVTKIGGKDLGTVDLICGGFPCQDLSVAGRRAGLAGERSGLFYEFMRIVGEVAPRWVLIENVPGLLSSNGGRDMGAVLGTLGQLGYGYAWRILDSQYFGVPQRRRRVFIVGHLGGFCPPEVLFEPESLPGDSPPSRETGEGASRSLTSGSGGGRYDKQPVTIIEGDSAASTPQLPRLRAGCGRAGEAAIVSPTLMAESYSPTKCQEGDEANWTVLAHTLRAEGHDASEDGTGRGTPIVAQAFHHKASSHQSMNPSKVCPALGTTKEPAVAFAVNQRREGRLSKVHGSLHEPSGTQVDGVLAFDALNHTESEVQHTLRGGVSGAAWGGVTVAAVPRRLTPRECERLQAFPDDWTRYDSEGREIADSPRYRMLGNAVTVSVAEWIGRRILALERELQPPARANP